MQRIRIGSRKSKLSLWQSNLVAKSLKEIYPEALIEIVKISTKGDENLKQSLPEIGGKGVFTEELERELINKNIDCAVHSLKDLPTENKDNLILGAVLKRASVEDVLITRDRCSFSDLENNSKIGTSSLRRSSQMKSLRNDIEVVDIRGNVPTRIEKVFDNSTKYDAVILAKAGVDRLNLSEYIDEIFTTKQLVPAPGQGAIAVQCLEESRSIFSKLNDELTSITTTVERSFLQYLGGGCSLPVGAYCEIENEHLTINARVVSLDGKDVVDVSKISIAIPEKEKSVFAEALGKELAKDALIKGAENIIAKI
ncbi:hydroxymethylbilane synthase [bacterium]|jgi:hydroxymethylbilane synthase|nr:hydroxymethylbilane synthase [bacterium]